MAFITTRLRLDAALYEPAPARRPGQIGRPRLKGECLPNLSVVAEAPNTVWKLSMIAKWYGERERMVEIASETAVWYSTGILCSWFVMRWQLEVSFQEVRRHLGFETQRQWSDLAIRRTTPALLGLFSLVTLFAHRRMRQACGAFRQADWYHKSHPTFSDALALVRKELWAQETFCARPGRPTP